MSLHYRTLTRVASVWQAMHPHPHLENCVSFPSMRAIYRAWVSAYRTHIHTLSQETAHASARSPVRACLLSKCMCGMFIYRSACCSASTVCVCAKCGSCTACSVCWVSILRLSQLISYHMITSCSYLRVLLSRASCRRPTPSWRLLRGRGSNSICS